MGKNTSVSLGDHFTHFVETQVAQGRYGSASDVMRAGLRLLEEHEAKLAALRAALDEGEASGVSDQNVLDIWAEVKAEADQSRNG
ncbi:antitoxin ParD1/3/4 [Nitrospirillum amazonense]|uniref:Antitoxin ParD1/3/4 n=1 Tax=Nitrospirillum amazonense TaxID=28077 RepID=A0A560FGW5_9PROT|nr:type II toxin-antitoxin system ParD family antitoxin [Nitrospirillum amazonense]TWB20853.1 antitoxin ParD1/3/4 [Nitrospirillum amazonense]